MSNGVKTGKIVDLNRPGKFGFIRGSNGHKVLFDDQDLHDPATFKNLKKGQGVIYRDEKGPGGSRQAVFVASDSDAPAAITSLSTGLIDGSIELLNRNPGFEAGLIRGPLGLVKFVKSAVVPPKAFHSLTKRRKVKYRARTDRRGRRSATTVVPQ